jgi:MFS family permease
MTMIGYGLFAVAVMVPLAVMVLRPPPEAPHFSGGTADHGAVPKVFGWPPNVIFALLAFASFLCCVTMSMPQAHLVALCSDLGISAQRGAAMLSLVLGMGFLCRQLWGAISDRIGGLLTLLAGSALQAAATTGFVLTQDEAGLFAVSAAFGLGFSALIPAYVLAVREHFPAHEAGWRVPTLLLLSGSGMATGSWLAGALYDYFGYYAPAFAAGVGFNLLNFAVIALLVIRQRLIGIGGRADPHQPNAASSPLQA